VAEGSGVSGGVGSLLRRSRGALFLDCVVGRVGVGMLPAWESRGAVLSECVVGMRVGVATAGVG